MTLQDSLTLHRSLVDASPPRGIFSPFAFYLSPEAQAEPGLKEVIEAGCGQVLGGTVEEEERRRPTRSSRRNTPQTNEPLDPGRTVCAIVEDWEGSAGIDDWVPSSASPPTWILNKEFVIMTILRHELDPTK